MEFDIKKHTYIPTYQIWKVSKIQILHRSLNIEGDLYAKDLKVGSIGFVVEGQGQKFNMVDIPTHKILELWAKLVYNPFCTVTLTRLVPEIDHVKPESVVTLAD